MRSVQVGFIAFMMVLVTAPSYAQLAPAPQKSPRTPVKSELIVNRTAMPANRLLQGEATVLDAERLRLGGYEVRLFGVVPPQMAASYGPQARGVVDALAKGSVTCQIKDRDREGRLLALCNNSAGSDFGIELLRRGLAVAARGTLQSSEFAGAYLAAEQAAQNQKLGLWSSGAPAAASESSIRDAVAKAAAAKAELERLKNEEAKARAQAEEISKNLPKIDEREATTVSLSDDALESTTASTALEDTLDTATAPSVDDMLRALPVETASAQPLPEQTFVQKYQLLITGILFLIATLCVIGSVAFYRLNQKKEDLKSVAAALRGELMAARSICQTRLAKIAQDGHDKTTSWPKFRTLVFQAYVGRLGMLGADLSRQIASIYGQTSDYASYYNAHDGHSEQASKRQALETLVNHIEEITPRLSRIEKTGVLSFVTKEGRMAATTALPLRSKHPLPLASRAEMTPPPDGPGTPQTPPEAENNNDKTMSLEMAESFSSAKTEVMAETERQTSPSKQPLETKETPPLTRTKNTIPHTAQEKQKPAAKPKPASTEKTKASVQAKPPLDQRAITPQTTDIKSSSLVNFAAPIFEKLATLKERLAAHPAPIQNSDPFDFSIPDYANLTEDELQRLLYADEELYMASPAGKAQQTG